MTRGTPGQVQGIARPSRPHRGIERRRGAAAIREHRCPGRASQPAHRPKSHRRIGSSALGRRRRRSAAAAGAKARVPRCERDAIESNTMLCRRRIAAHRSDVVVDERADAGGHARGCTKQSCRARVIGVESASCTARSRGPSPKRASQKQRHYRPRQAPRPAERRTGDDGQRGLPARRGNNVTAPARASSAALLLRAHPGVDTEPNVGRSSGAHGRAAATQRRTRTDARQETRVLRHRHVCCVNLETGTDHAVIGDRADSPPG
jgi:hypothetical protein